MSNPVTNVEVEDVLSSIRRLVSEDTGDGNQGRDADAERFVLTPAFRVESDPDQYQDEEPVLSLGQEHLVPLDTSTADEIGESTNDDLPDLSGATPWAQSEHDAPSLDENGGDVRPENALQDDEPESGAAFFSHRSVPLEDRVAELEAAIGQSPDEWEPDGSEPEADQAPMRHIFESSRNARYSEPEFEAEPDADVEIEEPQVQEPTFADSDMPEQQDASAEPPSPSHLHVASSDGEVMQTAAQVPDLPENDMGDDALIDEDSLREMVAEIVRQELQGMLGERITRNVRRMVRREIQRALVLKDFE